MEQHGLMCQIASEHFAGNRWELIRQFIPSALLPTYTYEVLKSKARQVTVGEGSERWTEFKLEPKSQIGSFLQSLAVYNEVSAITGYSLGHCPKIWAQKYHIGQRISWHCDSEGLVQFLVCLQTSPSVCGGAFCMMVQKSEVQVHLEAGDAIIFEAARIPHCTTRLVAKEIDLSPLRVTAVARFFAKKAPQNDSSIATN
jgi:hypothetical protein